MCNFFCWCALFLALLLSAQGSNVTESDTAPYEASHLKGAGDLQASEELPTASKLVRSRYRRQPPYALLKHSTRTTKRSKLRRRIKAPKIKYGPPNFKHGEPISYYKPSLPTHSAGPSFSIDDFQHIKFDGSDFRIDPSSYEGQSMDLDFYNHEDLYGAHKFPSLEYSFETGHESPPKSSYDHTPHQKYGIPPVQHSPSFGSYEKPESFVTQHYQAPPYLPPPASQNIPSTRYGVPTGPVGSVHAPAFTHADAPLDDYAMIYEPKIPNTGYHHFAEPPAPEPTQNTNYEISHSPPVYEINTSFQANSPQYGQNFQPPHAHGDSYVELPKHPSTYAQPQPPVQSYPEPQPSAPNYPHEDYAPPSQELPLNPNHKFPSFDFPKSSYEVPIYDPIPFEASNKDEQESYPPILEQGQNSNEGLTPEHSLNEVQVSTPDAHPAGSSKQSTKGVAPHQRHKRKRVRGPPSSAVVPTKHTLDVPELQEAFETEHSYGKDADTNESHYVEHKRKLVNYVTTTSTTPAPLAGIRGGPWNPMRVRTTASTAFVPTIITSTPAPSTRTASRGRQRASSRYRTTQTNRDVANTPQTDHTASSIVSIQKSHSKSYYDGTIAPPTYQQQLNTHGAHGPRPNHGRGSVAYRSTGAVTEFPRQTTKSVFDTTYFKSPHNDKKIERKLNVLHQFLPKNHKLY